MRLNETIKRTEQEMTGDGENKEDRDGPGITLCISAWGVKRVLLTQFVAVHLSSTRINTECTSSFIFMLCGQRIALFHL